MRPTCAAGALAVIGILALGPSVLGQDSKNFQSAPPDAYLDGSPLAYYGSENQWSRRQFSEEKADKSSKRRGQRQLLAILDGEPAQAIKWAQRRLDADPSDLEAIYTQTVAWCRQGQIDLSISTMKKAIAAGLPLERFLAGPRDLLKPLYQSQAFREIAAQRSIRIIHGPMLGCVTDRSAKVWLRTVDQSQVVVQVYACDKQGQPTRKIIATGTATSDPQHDYTAVVELEGLQPETQYAYDVIIAEKSAIKGSLPRLRTYPQKGDAAKFRIAFGGGAGYVPRYETMWDTIESHQPDVLFLLGDNVYIDLAEEPRGMHRYTYYRRQSRPEYRRLVSSTPVYAIWDDHDCAIDDVWMGPFVDRPSWKPAMLDVFRENWVNPAYGNKQAPGCWFQTSIADVDFFFLDTRYYRTNPFGEQPTMLGPIQKAWLFKQIKNSQATFKVIVSSVPWASGSKPGSHDTWNGFPAEREEIFSALEVNKSEGVLLLSADRHRSDAWKIERPNGYALYDMMSSRLTNEHPTECFPEALFCYNKTCSFGLLTIDTTQADPVATYQIIDIDGKIVHTLPLIKSQLSF
jgi:alkaline phosphatase D